MAWSVALAVVHAGVAAGGTGSGGQFRTMSEGSEASIARARSDRRTQTGGFRPSDAECSVRASDHQLSGLDLDCDSDLPNNEPAMVVDPTDPRHVVVTSNDYDSCCSEFYTTFDGGQTWRTGDLAALGGDRTGSDPVVAIDPAHYVVINAALSVTVTADGEAADGHIVASVSSDGGITWDRPIIVAAGWGADDDATQLFNDKPWIVTDTNPTSPYYGRTYLTWSRFRASSGETRESPIWLASSDDGGRHWTAPKEISGRNPAICHGASAGERGRCAGDQNSSPVVRPDGALFVGFLNNQDGPTADDGTGGDQYLIVRSDDGGTTFSSPARVAAFETTRRDYPLNAEGRPTLTGVQTRVLFTVNLAVSGLDGRLVVAFADNRAGRRDAEPPVTNMNVYLMTSLDGDRWNGPFPVTTEAGDQWDPWVAISPEDGHVGVLYLDGNAGGNGLYGVTLAEGTPGAFRYRSVAPPRSDLREARFFPARVPRCTRCTLFNGDYINLVYGPDGRPWAAWTDMRDEVTVAGRTGHGERIYVATP
ncbi:MAG: glycoside hydrolase [Actinobacteria bacterium]|nr:glycoside hydrolase [Actinomycetota bacterium]